MLQTKLLVAVALLSGCSKATVSSERSKPVTGGFGNWSTIAPAAREVDALAIAADAAGDWPDLESFSTEDKLATAAALLPDEIECSQMFKAVQGFSLKDHVSRGCSDLRCTSSEYVASDFFNIEARIFESSPTKFYVVPALFGDDEPGAEALSDEHVGWVVYSAEMHNEPYQKRVHRGLRTWVAPSGFGGVRSDGENSPFRVVDARQLLRSDVNYEVCTKTLVWRKEISTALGEATGFPGSTTKDGVTTASYKVDEAPVLLGWLLTRHSDVAASNANLATMMGGFNLAVALTPGVGTADSFQNCTDTPLMCAALLGVDLAGDVTLITGIGAGIKGLRLGVKSLGKAAEKIAPRAMTVPVSERTAHFITRGAIGVDVAGNLTLGEVYRERGDWGGMIARTISPAIDIVPMTVTLLRRGGAKRVPNAVSVRRFKADTKVPDELAPDSTRLKHKTCASIEPSARKIDVKRAEEIMSRIARGRVGNFEDVAVIVRQPKWAMGTDVSSARQWEQEEFSKYMRAMPGSQPVLHYVEFQKWSPNVNRAAVDAVARKKHFVVAAQGIDFSSAELIEVCRSPNMSDAQWDAIKDNLSVYAREVWWLLNTHGYRPVTATHDTLGKVVVLVPPL